ncbi:MAG: peptidoglycan DD-metalloendopeptidase family protein [Candidatus Symbiobacter sp.]|nr:peptidoglycan DD-metalloendopeptidase family protein [Candidatus Symbiobacter sp.]
MPKPPFCGRVLWGGLVGGVLLWLAPQANASATEQDLHVIEQDRRHTAAKSQKLQQENAALVKERLALQARLVAAGRGALSLETTLNLLDAEIVKTESERLRRIALWRQNQGRMALMLGALERMALRPPSALLLTSLMPKTAPAATAPPAGHHLLPDWRASTQAAHQTARIGVVLTSLVPLMNARAQRLRLDMLDLQALEAKLQEQKTALGAAKQSLALRRDVIADLLLRRQALENSNRAEAKRLAARLASLAQSSRSLRELAAKIESAPPPIGGFSPPKNQAPLNPGNETGTAPGNETDTALGNAPDNENSPRLIPVAGQVILSWGQLDAYGQAARGLTLQTRPGATVIAPARGRVLFAGPFHNYAGVLIIGISPEYVCVLTGLGRIAVQTGETVAAGEVVGTMDAQRDSLYFEVRRQGKPINPLPWLKQS